MWEGGEERGEKDATKRVGERTVCRKRKGRGERGVKERKGKRKQKSAREEGGKQEETSRKVASFPGLQSPNAGKTM